MKLAVVGAGWAGLAAAVRAVQAGHAVTVYDMAPQAGGRARSDGDATSRDNGQHILLGGYGRTLALMRDVGVDSAAVFIRSPLDVAWPDGTRFALTGRGPRFIDTARALVRAPGFSLADKLSLARSVLAWRTAGFDCDAALTAAELLGLTATPRLRERLLAPLCIAALNTPVEVASARVFLAVLRDGVFGQREASDLLIPRVPLTGLLPGPAIDWLLRAGAQVRLRTRVMSIEARGLRWRLSGRAAPRDAHADGSSRPDFSMGDREDAGDEAGDEFDGLVVAASASEAARLIAPIAPAWAATANALAHEPIATLWLRTPHRPWPSTMLALPSDGTQRPAQFAFKSDAPPHASSGLESDHVTLVASAAGAWVERGMAALREAAVAQAREALGFDDQADVQCLHARIDRRATFRCAAGVVRPPPQVASGLVAAGDYVDSPYPATLEAAVLSGEAALAALEARRTTAAR